jgi:hypothetical protein
LEITEQEYEGKRNLRIREADLEVKRRVHGKYSGFRFKGVVLMNGRRISIKCSCFDLGEMYFGVNDVFEVQKGDVAPKECFLAATGDFEVMARS